MTTASTIRRLALVLALATPPVVLPCTSRAGGETPAATGERTHPSSPSYTGGERDDPARLRHAGSAGTLRPLGDALFARPVNFLQLVAGVAMLPLALPIATLFAEPRDALDICVSRPYEMLVRPLGE
jgi:hypothetical protein